MRDCETCPLRTDFIPDRHAQADTPIQIRRLTDKMSSQLEAEREHCPGWSVGRYAMYGLSYQLNIDGLNVSPPHEKVCNNPYRTTDDYWDLRTKIRETTNKLMHSDRADDLIGKVGIALVEAAIDVTKDSTRRRIARQQKKLNKK